MNNSFHVAVRNAGEQLEEKLLDFKRLHVFLAEGLKVVLEVPLHVLEDEIKLFIVDTHVF